MARILVVEDDPRLAATLDRVLGAERHEVEVAGDGGDALRRARERSFDLVVLDIMLPGLDGIAVCRRLRSTGPIPILLLTALAGTEERVRGLDSGADDYLVKPFAYEELLARVRALLRRTTPPDHLRFGDLRLQPSNHPARIPPTFSVLPAPPPTPTPRPAPRATPAPSPPPTAVPAPRPAPTATPNQRPTTPAPRPSASPAPTPAPTPSAAPSPAATPAPTPTATASAVAG